MPKIVTPNTSFAIKIAAGGNYYRLVGLEFASTSTSYSQYLVYGGSLLGQPLVDSITVDRCHPGWLTDPGRRD